MAVEVFKVVVGTVGARDTSRSSEERLRGGTWLAGSWNFSIGGIQSRKSNVATFDILEILDGSGIGIKGGENAGQILKIVKRVVIAGKTLFAVEERFSLITDSGGQLGVSDVLFHGAKSKVTTFLQVFQQTKSSCVGNSDCAHAFVRLQVVVLVTGAEVAGDAIKDGSCIGAGHDGVGSHSVNLLSDFFERIVIDFEVVASFLQVVDVGDCLGTNTLVSLQVDEGGIGAGFALGSVEDGQVGGAEDCWLGLVAVLLFQIGDGVVVDLDVVLQGCQVADVLTFLASFGFVVVEA